MFLIGTSYHCVLECHCIPLCNWLLLQTAVFLLAITYQRVHCVQGCYCISLCSLLHPTALPVLCVLHDDLLASVGRADKWGDQSFPQHRHGLHKDLLETQGCLLAVRDSCGNSHIKAPSGQVLTWHNAPNRRLLTLYLWSNLLRFNGQGIVGLCKSLTVNDVNFLKIGNG